MCTEIIQTENNEWGRGVGVASDMNKGRGEVFHFPGIVCYCVVWLVWLVLVWYE